jgi:hypothetical protein
MNRAVPGWDPGRIVEVVQNIIKAIKLINKTRQVPAL